MNDPVYKAIVTLCDLKGKASYAEIASVAGIKKQKAVDFLLRNKRLLKQDAKGNITGFIKHEANVYYTVYAMFTQGKVYKTVDINYGADKAVEVHPSYQESVKHLIKPYCVGGFGDNYMANYIVVNEKTKEIMEALGFRHFDEVVKEKIDKGEDQVWRDWCAP